RLAGQIRLVRRWRAQRAQRRLALTRVLRLQQRLKAQIDEAQNIDRLRGLEGVAGRLHFSALRAVLPPRSGFVRRQRRPPPDPVNAALSLGYSLLYGRAVEAVHRAGL